MSRLITHTNILVDDFDFGKSFPEGTFVYFLTHFHADHYEGLSPRWNYGPINCTHATARFILDERNYPKLTCVHAHDYNKIETLTLPNNHTVHYVLLDAKHIPGSAMILFQGFMGTILFTGDFRYEYSMVTENPELFPASLREHHTKQYTVYAMQGISIHVDYMIFDNTYCHPCFDFGTEKEATSRIVDIIERNPGKIVYIAMAALGKQRILLRLAKHFQTSIVVSEHYYHKMSVSGLETDYLTTNPSEGFINLVNEKQRSALVSRIKKGLEGDSFICIDTDFLMLDHQSPDKINYIVPYSLHSNYKYMETLIRLVRPSILRKIVIPYANFKHVKLRIKIDHRIKFAKYLDFLESELNRPGKSGYAQLVRDYTAVDKLSKQYLQWFNPKLHTELLYSLGLGHGEQNHALRKRKIVLKDYYYLSNTYNRSSNKPSLKDTADGLNAVHKNHSLYTAFYRSTARGLEVKCDKLMTSSLEDLTRNQLSYEDDEYYRRRWKRKQ